MTWARVRPWLWALLFVVCAWGVWDDVSGIHVARPGEMSWGDIVRWGF